VIATAIWLWPCLLVGLLELLLVQLLGQLLGLLLTLDALLNSLGPECLIEDFG
jgi:hypothetical protein